MSGPNHPRGTTNRNDRGGAVARRARKQYLLDTFGDGKHAPCHYCRKALDFITITVDRVIPKMFGGTYARHNIRPACLHCNAVEGTRLREAVKNGIVKTVEDLVKLAVS
jgi:hypothetical protein